MNTAVGASVRWQLHFLFRSPSATCVCAAVHRMARKTLQIFIIVYVRLVVIADSPSTWATIQVPTAIFAVQRALTGVQGRKVVAFVDGRS